MFRTKYWLGAVVLASAAAVTSVVAAPEGKLLDVKTEMSKVATADHVKVIMTPPITSYRAPLKPEELQKFGCGYESGPAKSGAVKAIFDILRKGITAYHGELRSEVPDARFEVDFIKGDQQLGTFTFGDNYGGDYSVDGALPAGWGTIGPKVPQQMRAWAKRTDVRKVEPVAHECDGQDRPGLRDRR